MSAARPTPTRSGRPRRRRRLLRAHLGTAGGVTRTYLAVLRIADGSQTGRAVHNALAVVDSAAYSALHEELHDPVPAWLAQLVADGLYLRTLTGTPLPPGLGVDDLLSRMRTYLPPP